MDRLLHACGLRSFAYRRYPPVRIEEPNRSAPLAEAREMPEPDATAIPAGTSEPVPSAPGSVVAEPLPTPPAQVTFLNPARLRAPAPAAPLPIAALPPELAPAPQAAARAAMPPVLRQVDAGRSSLGQASGGSGFPAPAPVPFAPARPARRFALLDEVAAEIAPPRPVAAAHAAPVSPASPPSQPPPAPPRLRLRRRVRPAGDL